MINVYVVLIRKRRKPIPLGRGSVNSYSGEYSNVRDNLEQNPQELTVARRLLLEAYNKSKAIKGVIV